MSGEWSIYHNSRCSKSREALAILYAHDIAPTVMDYLRNPPSPSELHELVAKLGIEPRALLRTKESIYTQLHLDLKDADAIYQVIHEHPILLERPIVVRGRNAVIGRPPEKILDLIQQEK